MKTAKEFIEKYTTKDQDDWLVQKKDIVTKFMEAYANAKLQEVAEKAKVKTVKVTTGINKWGGKNEKLSFVVDKQSILDLQIKDQ